MDIMPQPPVTATTPQPTTPTPLRQSLSGQNGLDAARRRSPEFARMLTESAEQLAPDPRAAADRITQQNLIDQTAAMNILAARWSTAFNPAIINYASHFANQVSLEGNVQPRRPLKQGDELYRGLEVEPQFRTTIPPINEAQAGPEVL
jgi:hypothetical protein